MDTVVRGGLDPNINNFLLFLDFLFDCIVDVFTLLFSNWLLATFTVLTIFGFLLPFFVRLITDNK